MNFAELRIGKSMLKMMKHNSYLNSIYMHILRYAFKNDENEKSFVEIV